MRVDIEMSLVCCREKRVIRGVSGVCVCMCVSWADALVHTTDGQPVRTQLSSLSPLMVPSCFLARNDQQSYKRSGLTFIWPVMNLHSSIPPRTRRRTSRSNTRFVVTCTCSYPTSNVYLPVLSKRCPGFEDYFFKMLPWPVGLRRSPTIYPAASLRGPSSERHQEPFSHGIVRGHHHISRTFSGEHWNDR